MHPILGELSDLLIQARRVSGDADKAPLFLRSEMRFTEGKNIAAPMAFNIPVGEDFYATRLNIYLASRLISIASPDTEAELTLRPTDWTSVDEYFSYALSPDAGGVYVNKYASCFFEIASSTGKKFQNAPLSQLHAFSDREPMTKRSAFGPPASGTLFFFANYAAYNGGMDFDVDERIPAGTVWSLNITPTFSRDVSATSVDRRELAAIGVLTGYKKVKPRGAP